MKIVQTNCLLCTQVLEAEEYACSAQKEGVAAGHMWLTTSSDLTGISSSQNR